ncbi:MAG TPA: ParA family protein [Anaerolineaceae bacterium]
MARIIAFSNHKGGVGKTTSCVSIGACLVEMGNRVLLVDMDPQANLTLACGLDPDTLDKSLVDVLDPDIRKLADISGLVSTTRIPGMDILPSDARMANAERNLYGEDGYEDVLLEILKDYQQSYDFILVDCPPTISGLTLIALSSAHFVIVPVQCEYYAAKGLHLLLDVIHAVQEHSGRKLSWFLLATLFDNRNKIHRIVLEQIHQTFPDNILQTVLRTDTHLRECPLVGEPITLYAPKTRASEEYRQVTREFLEKIGN